MVKYQTKAEIAYGIILDRISDATYKAGDKLVIRQLSQELNMSEIPIREAIKRLESEGYLNHDANKSVTICELSKEELNEFFQIKGVLEGYASRLSIDYLSEEDIKEIEDINNAMKKAIEDGEINEIPALNQQFHMRIYRNIPNKELVSMITNLWNKWAITKRVFITSPERATHSVEEHDEIIKLLKNREYDEIETYTREHKFKSGRKMVESLKS